MSTQTLTKPKKGKKGVVGESHKALEEGVKNLIENATTGLQTDEEVRENKKKVKAKKVEKSREIHASPVAEVVNKTDTQLVNEKERMRFQELEEEIGAGVTNIESGTMKIAIAMTEIREERLYRSEYSSFAVYCEERWNLSRGYCNKLIDGLRVYKNLEEKIESDLLPESVNTVVSLASLPGDKQIIAYRKGLKEANKKGNGKKVTYQLIKTIADKEKEKINGKGESEKTKPTKSKKTEKETDYVAVVGSKISEIIELVEKVKDNLSDEQKTLIVAVFNDGLEELTSELE